MFKCWEGFCSFKKLLIIIEVSLKQYVLIIYCVYVFLWCMLNNGKLVYVWSIKWGGY